ncbi:orotate phosphoribosyltransferase [Anaerotaenia torta]|uniref:helix-turn-helix domain-containing protein n=1 Tax=Anaerotaenia torta TaxID=433293 RepID=UPI003D1B6D38
MVSIGDKIKILRKLKGITQEELSDILHISYQAISKWENGAAQPDISTIPVIANYFGVTIDELFGYKMNALTNKERFIQFIVNNGMLKIDAEYAGSNDEMKFNINTEKFETNAQISKIGGFFADVIRENAIEFDTLMGLAYHGIAFSSAASIALFEKYGVSVNYCYDRLVPDSRNRIICGHTLTDNEKVVIVDDLIFSGSSLIERVERLKKLADIKIAAVIVIADFMSVKEGEVQTGAQRIEERYGTKVYSIVTRADITRAINNDIIAGRENPISSLLH